ncbi:MAG: hypothetical protein IKP47_03610 [Ruminococcus sp.]|nr:hypothetical protein [Ruminococcus sp.]
MKKAFNYVSAALFFIFCGIFAVSTLFLSDKLPDVTPREGLAEDTEKFVCDNFPLQANWRSMYSSIVTAAGQSRIGNVYISDDALIEIISKADENKTNELVERINTLALDHPNVAFYSLIVPTASGIYSEELPMMITALDQQKLIDDIYFKLDSSIHTLDAYTPLFSARADYVYFRTDNRWTEYGAYTVYNKVIRKLGFSPVRLSSYDMEYADREFYGDLYSKTYYKGVGADLINIFKNKNGSFVTGVTSWSDGVEFNSSSIYYTPALSTSNKLDLFLGGNSFEKCRIMTSNTDAPKLLMIKGSYSNMFVPFLTPHYSEITLIDPQQLEGTTIEEAVDIDSFDQVLILYDVSKFC